MISVMSFFPVLDLRWYQRYTRQHNCKLKPLGLLGMKERIFLSRHAIFLYPWHKLILKKKATHTHTHIWWNDVHCIFTGLLVAIAIGVISGVMVGFILLIAIFTCRKRYMVHSRFVNWTAVYRQFASGDFLCVCIIVMYCNCMTMI